MRICLPDSVVFTVESMPEYMLFPENTEKMKAAL